MNQKNVSGIGNYLKAECLYDAKISPHRFCSQITIEESNKLFFACRRIINLSYKIFTLLNSLNLPTQLIN